MVLGAALATEVIGIHALFGAFFAGAILPADEDVRRGLRERLESFSAVFLLPLFFAFTGLRTQVGLLDDGWAWLTCGAIIALATVGKLAGSTLTARLMGIDWNSSFILGALMNTRGLMELIALNVGYDLGVISPEMFNLARVDGAAHHELYGAARRLRDESPRARPVTRLGAAVDARGRRRLLGVMLEKRAQLAKRRAAMADA